MDVSMLDFFRISTFKVGVLNVIYSIILIILSFTNPVPECSAIIDSKEKLELNQTTSTDKIIFLVLEMILIGLNLVVSVRLIIGALKGNVKDCILWIGVHSLFLLFIIPLLVLGYFGTWTKETQYGWIVFCGIILTLCICIEFWTISMFIKELRKQQNGNFDSNITHYGPGNNNPDDNYLILI